MSTLSADRDGVRTQPRTAPRTPHSRQRRSRAALALVGHGRRAQLGWDDLAAWPAWADQPADLPALTGQVGAVWHAPALRQCIHGATLQVLQHSLGEATLQAVLHGGSGGADSTVLPAVDELPAWLQDQGAEVLLATLPSPLLRLLLRERLWPQALPMLPPPDPVAAALAVQQAMALPVRGAGAGAGAGARASATATTGAPA